LVKLKGNRFGDGGGSGGACWCLVIDHWTWKW
jgi:hypothetical protein